MRFHVGTYDDMESYLYMIPLQIYMSCLHTLNCQLITKETQALLINPKSNDSVQYAVFLWEKKTAAKEFKKKKRF